MFILLDIDGVMVPATSWKPLDILNDGFYGFSSTATKNLQKIISETGASIILTTSHKSNYHINDWKNIFKSRGIETSINKLDDNINYAPRKDEILNWLTNHNIQKDFVIIDDDKSLHNLPASIKEKLVLTSPYIGLTDDNATAAIEILKSSKLSSV